jgi:hypothetical protein
LKISDTSKWVPSRWLRSFAIVVVFVIAFASRVTKADGPQNWSRILTDGDEFARTPGISFVVSYVRHESDLLSVPTVAICWYRYTVGTDPVILHGSKRPDGSFEPILTYEVATEGKTKWRKIHADAEQVGSETIAVNPENPIAKLWVDMQPFQKYLGVSRYGRLILENGDTAIFEIEDLLPTADAQGDAHDYKETLLQTDDEKKKEGFSETWIAEPGTLFSIISLGNRLIGDFLFETRPTKAVSLEGTRTVDGDFWPQVDFQVANSGEQWKTIGKSRNGGTSAVLQIPSGKAERMRVLLTDYKSMIGKYTYGKIVFSNGQSAIFSIDLLDAKK